MKLVVISDTHNRHKKIELPDGDVLIHCGDATGQGRSSEITEFSKWFHKQPHKYKIFVAGNHDIEFQKYPVSSEETLHAGPSKIHYLKDSEVVIEGVRFYGSPWTKRFGSERWAFMGEDESLSHHWDKIPEGIDVLITHGPPFGILDKNMYKEPCGPKSLRFAVEKLRPQIHVFGHIHEDYGTYEQSGTRYGNAAICDLSYNPINKPLIFEVSPRSDNVNTPVS